MTVQENFASISKLLNDIASSPDDNHIKLYKRRCESANKFLQEIKQKFNENETHTESLTGRTKSTSTEGKGDAKKDSNTSTFTLKADQNNQEGEGKNVAGLETSGPRKEDSQISASRNEPDVTEKQSKPDYDEIEKKLNSITTYNARLEKQLQEERKDNIFKKQQIDELTNRLSAFAAYQLTKDNPQIADLSDQCRPTKLAEGFSQLYDNQWTDVFEIFDKKRTEECQIIKILSHTIWIADKFCEKEKTEMTERILLRIADEINNANRSPKDHQKSSHASKLTNMTATTLAAERYVKDLMKALATESSQTIAQIFLDGPMKEVASKYKIKVKLTQLDTYALDAAKLVWMMKVQQPPIELLWAEPGSRFSKDTFKSYTKLGDIVDQCIWPAVLLHKDGPVMARGVVQGK